MTESSGDHLYAAGVWAADELDEETTAGQRSADAGLAAAQGQALRSVIFHGLAAICQAIRERP